MKSGDSVCASERTLTPEEQRRLKGRYHRDLIWTVISVIAWMALAASPVLSLALGRPVGLLLSPTSFIYIFLFSTMDLTARVSWVQMFRFWGMRRDLAAGKTLVFHSREPGRRITRIEDVTHFEILPASGGEWLRRSSGNWDVDPELPPLRAGRFDDDLEK